MGFSKKKLCAVVSLLTVLSVVYVPNLPMVTTSRVFAQTADARKAEADRLLQQGIELWEANKFTPALQSWQQALQIYREIKDRKGEGQSLGNIGSAYHSLKSYPKAIDYQQQSLAIARELKNRQDEGAALGNLGVIYDEVGEHTKAIDYLEQSLAIAREVKNRESERNALLNIGNAHKSLGDYSKGIDYYQQSLALSREIKDRKSERDALDNLGNTFDSLEDYSKGIGYHQQSLVISREIKDRESEGQSLQNLGRAYYYLGDYPKAIGYLQLSLKIAREIKDRKDEGQLLGNIGLVYIFLDNYSKAIEYLQQSLVIIQETKDRKGEDYSLGNLGLAYYFLGDYHKAIDYHQQRLAIARKIKDSQSESAAIGNLGLTYYSLGDYSKAIKYLQKTLTISRETQDRKGEGISLSNLGLTYYKQGNLALAEKTLMEGIKVYEYIRGRQLKDSEKISIFETQRNIYRTLQQVLIAQNKTDAALEISERGRARAFVELLTSRLSSNPLEQSPKPPNIEEIKQIAKAQNSTLVQYSIIDNDFKVAAKQETKESELYIWVIKPTGEVIFRTADLKPLWQKYNTTLSQLVSTTRESLGVRDDERNIITMEIVNPGNEKVQKNNLQKLHQLLIKPIADILPTDPNQRVIFVPQDDLFLVPFPALLDEQGKYLIEKHTITTAPAIQVLELTRQQKQRIGVSSSIPQNAVVVGNPIMPEYSVKYGEPPKQLKPLPGSEREAKAIAPLLNTQALIGSQATETAIKAKLSQAGVIHFATHSLFDNLQGLQSSIALAPSTKDNGFLTAEEILDLKLKADLVVLSACNTGRGKITGDGVIGLSRSLISAGVPSVLVSLWSIPDSPTASLMTEFYHNLNTSPDKAQALRQAMLITMKQHPNPRDWAAFTLIGEAE